MKLRKVFDDPEYIDFDVPADDCPFCFAAAKGCGIEGVIYLENDSGHVHRIEMIETPLGLVTACACSSADEAVREMAEVAVEELGRRAAPS